MMPKYMLNGFDGRTNALHIQGQIPALQAIYQDLCASKPHEGASVEWLKHVKSRFVEPVLRMIILAEYLELSPSDLPLQESRNSNRTRSKRARTASSGATAMSRKNHLAKKNN